jgi:hypothetical protein
MIFMAFGCHGLASATWPCVSLLLRYRVACALIFARLMSELEIHLQYRPTLL